MPRLDDGHVNCRGNTVDRHRRRLWMLAEWGDGVEAPCWECGTPVDYDTIIADRLVPGREGGTYRRDNIKGPHCKGCSTRQGYLTGMGRR
jgi:hypothetical protein